MIESNIIKRFIVKTFMQHSRSSIGEISETIMIALGSKFFVNESVIIRDTQELGKVTKCTKDTYTITMPDGQELEQPREHLRRKGIVTYEDVISFIEAATKQTAFGRILIENVFEKMLKPDFGAKTLSEARQAKEEAKNRNMFIGHPPPYNDMRQDPRMHHQHGLDHMPRDIPKKEDGRKILSRNKHEKLDISLLPHFVIDNFKETPLTNLIKIYMILINFKEDFNIGDIKIDELAGAIFDQEYGSELVFRIHSTFISIIENEAKIKKERFFESLYFIIEKLKPFETDIPVQSLKKRIPMTLENWKAQSKIFIQNFSKELDEDRILRFAGFAKKDVLDLRLEFLVFLIDILTLTDRFRDFVDVKQNSLRAEKARSDELNTIRKRKAAEEMDDTNDISREITECDANMVNHPLKIHLGKYQSYPLFLMDKKVILKDSNDFYILRRSDLMSIIKDLNVHTKSGKSTAVNLKATFEIFF